MIFYIFKWEIFNIGCVNLGEKKFIMLFLLILNEDLLLFFFINIDNKILMVIL